MKTGHLDRPFRLGVLASGTGTNLARIVAACESGELDARVALAVVNVPGAGAIDRAQQAGVPVTVLDHRAFPDRAAHERAIAAALAAAKVDLVVLAGYMRRLTPFFIGAWWDPQLGQARIVNVHPADPARYQGPDGYGWAIATRQAETAVAVHFVDEGLDTGEGIVLERLGVLPDDDVTTLKARGQAVEHRILPRAIAQVLDRLAAVHGRLQEV